MLKPAPKDTTKQNRTFSLEDVEDKKAEERNRTFSLDSIEDDSTQTTQTPQGRSFSLDGVETDSTNNGEDNLIDLNDIDSAQDQNPFNIARQDSPFQPKVPTIQDFQKSPEEDKKEEPGAFDFSEEAIGTPWARGLKQLYQAGASIVDFSDYYYDKLVEEMTDPGIYGEDSFIGKRLSGAEKEIKASSHAKLEKGKQYLIKQARTTKTKRSNIGELDSFWDIFEPNRIYSTFAEAAPVTGTLALTTIANPAVGSALMLGVEGGDTLRGIEELEKQGIEVDPALKNFAPLLVGSLNAALERTGIENILNVAKSPGLKRKLLSIATSALIEGGTEGIQDVNKEITKEIARTDYEGFIPDNIGETFVKSFYTGMVVGTGISGAAEGIGSISYTQDPDARIVRYEQNEDGSLKPVFEVTRPDAENRGQEVDLDYMDESDLNTPEFRRDKMKQEMIENVESMSQTESEAMMLLVDAFASNLGISTEQYLQDINLDITKGNAENITNNDLFQVSAYHGTPHSFDKFSTDAIGTGEGNQAFGWGLYFTESKNIAQWYAENLSKSDPNNPSLNLTYKGNTFDTNREFLESVAEGSGVNIDVNMMDLAFTINRISNESVSNNNINSDVLESKINDEISKRKDRISEFEGTAVAEQLNQEIKVLESLDVNNLSKINANRGSVKRVTLNKGKDIDSYKWLPWESEMKESEVSDIVETLRKRAAEAKRNKKDNRASYLNKAADTIERNLSIAKKNNFELMGQRIYYDIQYSIPSDQASRETSKILSEIGYDGTTYRADQGRSKSSNYVVFNEDIITIEETQNLEQRSKKALKGSVAFEDGRTVIRAFTEADTSTMLHEMAHVFRRTLPEDQLKEASEAFGIEGNWTRENEEAFARAFEKFLATGKTENDSLKRTFRKFRDWMLEIYGRISGSDIGVDLNKDQRQVFENMLGDVRTEIDQMQDELEKASAVKKWGQRVYDWFDIEGRFNRVGFEETGFNFKNYFSVKEVYIQEGNDIIRSFTRALGADRSLVGDAILMAESQEALENADKDSKVYKAAKLLRDYFDKSLVEYQARGGLSVGFRERLISDVRGQLQRAEGKEADNLQQLSTELEEAQDVEYVSIPFYAWFDSAIKANYSKTGKTLAQVVGRYKRETPTIQKLIDEGIISKEDLSIGDIVGSYAKVKGDDMALLNIRQAAIREGAVKPIQKGQRFDPGFYDAPYGAHAFRGFQMRAVVADYIREQIVSKDKVGWFESLMRNAKMWAFFNPLFLPGYDVYQSVMVGAIQITKPIRNAKLITKGFTDVYRRTEDFYDAEANGIASKAFNNQYESIQKDANRAERLIFPSYTKGPVRWAGDLMSYGQTEMYEVFQKTFGDGPAGFMKELGGIYALYKSIYNVSFDTAWYLDRTVRQVTYNHFIEEGKTPREAAQLAATAHADYASLPPKSRRTMNKIFFTPTFKVAMGKFFYSSLKSMGNELQGNANPTQKELSRVIIRTTGILVAYDILMLGLGFDRDEFGRRYTRPVDTETGDKELVVNWTGPHNLFLKYAQRTKAAFDPEVPNSMKRLVSQNSWELQPVLRIGNQLINNQSPGGGKIYFVSDNPGVKLGKTLTFVGTNVSSMLQTLSKEEAFGKQGGELFAKEYGQLIESVTAPFVFKYTRDPEAVRKRKQVQTLLRIYEEEVKGSQLIREIRRSGDAKKVIDDYLRGGGDIFNTPIKERSENLIRRMKQIIDSMEDEQYEYPTEEVQPVLDDTSTVQSTGREFSIDDLDG